MTLFWLTGPQIRAGKHLNYDSTTMGAANYGDHWRNVRRISNQEVFSVPRQNMFLSLRQSEVKSMIKSLFCTTGKGMQKVEMKSRISELTFNIIVGMVTGKRYCGEGVEDSAEAKEFREMIREIFELSAASNPGDFLPFLRWIDFGGYEKKMIKLKKRIDRILQNLIDECKRIDGGVAQSTLKKHSTIARVGICLNFRQNHQRSYGGAYYSWHRHSCCHN
ncbi:unnamed protein product [Rhodiola kirilowii]